MPTKSILFVPANKIELLPKAFAKQPDVVLLDLEDAVSLQEKDAAREQVFHYLTNHDLPENLALRINSITTPEGLADILALQKTKIKLTLMFLAKVESYAELEIYHQHLKAHCEKVIPFIESTKAFSQLTEIAKHLKSIDLYALSTVDTCPATALREAARAFGTLSTSTQVKTCSVSSSRSTTAWSDTQPPIPR